MDVFTRLFKTKSGRIFLTVYLGIFVSMMVYYIIKSNDRSLNELKYSIRDLDSQNEIMKRRMALDSISYTLNKQILETERLIGAMSDSGVVIVKNNIETKELIDSLFVKLSNVEEVTLSLRQAINPLKPDEVLTIARLKDEISTLQQDQKNFEKRIEDKIQNLSITVIDKAESSDKTTYLAIFILAPILFNFMYNVWKDNKAAKKAKKEE